jgi:hypothetical protein
VKGSERERCVRIFETKMRARAVRTVEEAVIAVAATAATTTSTTAAVQRETQTSKEECVT